MVKVWFINSTHEDKSEPHHHDPPKYITLDQLFHLTSVEYFKIDLNNFENNCSVYNQLIQERHFTYQDQIEISPKTTVDFDKKMRMFFQEHMHTDEEVRLCLSGSAYFDVREPTNDRWIRIGIIPGDMIILPSGIYHRFTLDKNDYVKMHRLFVDKPVSPMNRPVDNHPSRLAYVETIQYRREKVNNSA